MPVLADLSEENLWGNKGLDDFILMHLDSSQR